jgi:hypothetical protein
VAGTCSCGVGLLFLVLAVPASVVGQSEAVGPSLGKPQLSARSFEMIPMSRGPDDFRAFLRSDLRTPPTLDLSPEPTPPSFAFESLPGPPTDPSGAWRRGKLPGFVLKSPLFSSALLRGTLKEAVGQDLFRPRSEPKSRRIGFSPYMNFRREAVGMRLNLRLSAHP